MLRRTIGITATAAAISIAAILPAGAQTSPGGLDTYAAAAKARAMDLSVFGQTFTIADTASRVTSVPNAVASGNAVFTPLFASPAVAVDSATDATATQDCAALPIPVPSDLTATLVCIDASANLVNGNPLGSSKAHEVVVEVKAPAVIGDTTQLSDVVEQVQAGLGTLFANLVPVTQPLEEATQIQLDDILNGLIDEVQAGDVLVRITIAPASSVSQFDATGVVAKATSNGVIVELLPNLPGGPLAVATVGTSTSSVVRDAVTGAPTTTGGAALINITYPNGLLGGLAVLTDALGDALGTLTAQLPCSDANTLAQVICFDVGADRDLDAAEAKAMGFDFGPTTVGHTSSVLNLRLLAAAPMGGVILNIGETAVAASATTPLPKQDCIPNTGDPKCPPPPLPRTGGSSTLPITMALLAAGAAGAVLLRRSRTI